MVTVISSSATIELVAVSVNEDPAFSAIVDADDVKVIVGELSFSVIVIVTDCVPSSVADPPETVCYRNNSSFVSFINTVISWCK